jgi:hypothetical protein
MPTWQSLAQGSFAFANQWGKRLPRSARNDIVRMHKEKNGVLEELH